jgi:hypothetical protein
VVLDNTEGVFVELVFQQEIIIVQGLPVYITNIYLEPRL